MSVTSGGTAPISFKAGGSCSAGVGTAGISMIFFASHFPFSRYQTQMELAKFVTSTTTLAKPYVLRGSWAGLNSRTI